MIKQILLYGVVCDKCKREFENSDGIIMYCEDTNEIKGYARADDWLIFGELCFCPECSDQFETCSNCSGSGQIYSESDCKFVSCDICYGYGIKLPWFLLGTSDAYNIAMNDATATKNKCDVCGTVVPEYDIRKCEKCGQSLCFNCCYAYGYNFYCDSCKQEIENAS